MLYYLRSIPMMADTYTQAEISTLLSNKADKLNTYTKTQVDALIPAGGSTVNTYTKTEIDTALALKTSNSALATFVTTAGLKVGTSSSSANRNKAC